MTGQTRLHDENILDPAQYGSHGYPHDTWAFLRKEDPVHFVEHWAGDPYWAITKYNDIVEISKTPEVFKNAPRFFMMAQKGIPPQGFRSILDMDPPEHRTYRALVSRRFTPGALDSMRSQVHAVCDAVIEDAATGGDGAVVDFVDKISARLPIWVIAEMLGLPREDWETLYHWTNISVGADDPEYRKGRSVEETRIEALDQMGAYFSKIIADRRKNPRGDIATEIALARINGEFLPELELLTYYNVLLSGGNETTRNATTSGLLLLIQHPDQFERLKRNPKLVGTFIEEVLRITSPVIHMARTPHRDIEFRGKAIRAGTPMVMFYPSANRDEEIFQDSNSFLIDRDPNPHLAFGIGEHFCLGTHIARMELRAIFERLALRMDNVELVSEPERLYTNIVGGIKRLPIRYRLRSAA